MKPRTKKILIIAGASLGVLTVGTIIAVPMIASAIAPGIIQNAAADSIKGSLRVSDVSVGWTGPTRIGSIELLDDKGIVVAKLQATSTLGILSVLGGLNDLGTLTLSGSADITARQTDAGTVESNFQRAIAPRNATPPSASTNPSPLPEKTIRVDITSIDVKYTQLDRAGAPVASAQITALKGDAAVDLRRGQPSASLNLTGGIKQPAQPDGSIKITTKAQKFLSPQGTPDLSSATIDSDVQITAAPVGLVDALAGLNGQLREALGPAADLRLKAQGTTQQAAIDLTLTSAGVLVDGSMKITSGYLESTKPLTANLRSTDFLLRSPAISKALSRSNITLDAAAPAPAARFTVTSLRVPTNFSTGTFDARGISIVASASIDPISAQITTSDAAGERQRPIRTSPLNLTVESTDLAKGLTVRGGGTASIDSTPAGDLVINIAASDLFTDRGALRPVPGQIQAEASLMNIDTRLAQPLLGDLAQRINLSQELGPRVDIRALAKAAAATPNAIEADVSVKAQNIAANLPIIVDNASLRTRSDLAVNINRTTGVLNAFLGDQGVVISGSGAANLRGGFTLPRTSTGSFDTPALTSTLTFDLAALDAAVTREGQTRRVGMNQLKGTLAVVPSTPTKLQAQASGDDGWSFNTDLQVQGLLPTSTPAGSPLPFLAARRVTGTLSLRSLPTKYAALSGLDEAKLRTIAGVLGPSVSTEISLQGTAVQQQFTAVITSTNLNTQLGATLTESAATLNALQGNLRLTPEAAEAITTLLQASAPQARASATGDLNFKVTLSKPIAIKPAPAAATAGQSSSPTFDFSAVAINAAITSPEGLRVTNLPLTATRTFTGGLRDLQLTADAPITALTNPTSKEGHLGAQLRADLIEGQRPEPVASINADFDAAASLTEFKLQSSITNIDSQRVDTMLNQPGLVSGALGSPASITISATKEGPGTTKANATVQSPRLNLTGLALTQQGKALALTAPAEFTWTVEPAFLDQTLFAQSDPAARAAAPASLRVTQPITLEGKLETLALGIEGVGLFQPGTFALDASLSASTIKLSTPSAAGSKPQAPGARVAANQPTDQTDIEGFTIRIKGDTNLSVKAAATRVSTSTAAAPSNAAGPAPAAGSLSAEVLVKNFASPAGELDLSRAVIDAKIDAPSLPTALVDKLARTGKQLRDILGPEMSIALNAKGVTAAQPASAAANAQPATLGTLDARLTSVKPADAPKQPASPGTPTPPATTSPRQQANLELTGPVDRGVLKVSPQKPLSISLAQLKFESDTEIMGVLPLFASIQKTAGTTLQPATPTQPAIIEPPFTVTSPDLMIPLDGDISKLNGNLTITPGRIEYVFKRELGSFLDRTLLTDGELMQRPIPPFVVSFTNGVASYTDVRLPVRNFEFKLTGKVDLVRKEIDAVIYIPTVAASASIMSKLNDDLGRGFGGILPDVLSEGTMVPLRVTGPLSNPAYAPDPKLFFENFGSQLKKPADLIGKGIERGLGELFKPRDDKDKEKPKPR